MLLLGVEKPLFFIIYFSIYSKNWISVLTLFSQFVPHLIQFVLVLVANNLGVDAIFVYTKHGHMASLLSSNRPNPPIFAFTDNANARKSMNLYWGVIPIQLPLLDDMEENIKQTFNLMKSRNTVKPGDLVLVVSDSDLHGPFPAPSVFQSVQVRTIPQDMQFASYYDEKICYVTSRLRDSLMK